MRDSLRQFSGFVGEINALARYSDTQELVSWAVEQLSETVGFDSAWYGWAELRADGVDIHAQSSQNLTSTYYDSWCEMADQDLLAAAVRQSPGRTAVYDRFGNAQTDGMISLADNYGLKKMATAMHARPGRTASFFLSSYRGGRHCRAWSQQELDYLQCAVDHLSSAMKLSISAFETHAGGSGQSCFFNEDGIIILGLQNVYEQLSSLWPGWSGDRLPEHLREIGSVSGEHVLVDRKLIVLSETATVLGSMNLRKLTLRELTKYDLLTLREKEVADLLADGLSHKEVAKILGVAPATVRNQTQSIYAKMGLSSRAELALEVRSSSMANE